MNEDNKIFKTNEFSIEISPVKNTVDSQRAQYYSYDENSGLQRIHILKDGQPLGLPEGSEIRLSAVKLSGTKQMMVYTPEIEDRVKGIVTFVIPKEFLGYSGQIRCTLYIDFSSDQTLHAGYFYINMGISDIDANLPEFSDSYWQRWADFESEATVKMKELEGILDGEAQRLNEYADEKITEYDQKFQQTEQNIATLDQNLNELRENMKLSEAWAWSADGTDRFTPVYPRENLILNTSKLTSTINWAGTIALSKHAFYKNGTENLFKINNTCTTELTANTARFTVKAGQKYTLSFKGFQNSQLLNFDVFFFWQKKGSTGSYDGYFQPISAQTFSTSSLTTKEVVFTAPAEADTAFLRFDNNGTKTAGQSAELWFTEVCLRESDMRGVPYTPSPSEDYANAYPQYRGLALLPSDLPEDYVWEESAERIKQLAQKETDKLKGEVADIQNWIAQQGGTI